MRAWVGEEPKFYPHVALHDFEAWLLPYWDRIKALTGCNRQSPGTNPERVNHGNSPAYRLKEVFRIGSKTDSYIKTRDAGRILKDQDLGSSPTHARILSLASWASGKSGGFDPV